MGEGDRHCLGPGVSRGPGKVALTQQRRGRQETQYSAGTSRTHSLEGKRGPWKGDEQGSGVTLASLPTWAPISIKLGTSIFLLYRILR